ncbi:MAG: PLP-dependent aminotransferase family protein [Bacteroidales bacterium]
MISNPERLWSATGNRMKRSAIREVLKLTQRGDIISFAGGLPAPDSFPTHEIADIAKEVLETDGAAALQYGTTEGDIRLRKVLVDRYNSNEGLGITTDNLVICTASQQGLDLVGKIMLDPGDKVICGLPSYLGGISAFKSYGADLIGITLDDKGLRADLLDAKLKELQQRGEKPKFIYVIPDFQNPAGITMPKSRRMEILELAHKYDVLIVEDSPYREVRFEGESQPMFYNLDNTGQVVTLGTLSKIFVPGFRIGWMIGHEVIVDKFVMAKQSADLCTSSFVQKITALYYEKGYFDKNLVYIIDSYRKKRDLMLKSFEEYMPEEVSWTTPEGGLFLFMYLPETMDAAELLLDAIDEKVAYVQGDVFHCDGSGKNTLRINFSYASEEMNVEGVKRLANVIRKKL